MKIPNITVFLFVVSLVQTILTDEVDTDYQADAAIQQKTEDVVSSPLNAHGDLSKREATVTSTLKNAGTASKDDGRQGRHSMDDEDTVDITYLTKKIKSKKSRPHRPPFDLFGQLGDWLGGIFNSGGSQHSHNNPHIPEGHYVHNHGAHHQESYGEHHHSYHSVQHNQLFGTNVVTWFEDLFGINNNNNNKHHMHTHIGERPAKIQDGFGYGAGGHKAPKFQVQFNPLPNLSISKCFLPLLLIIPALFAFSLGLRLLASSQFKRIIAISLSLFKQSMTKPVKVVSPYPVDVVRVPSGRPFLITLLLVINLFATYFTRIFHSVKIMIFAFINSVLLGIFSFFVHFPRKVFLVIAALLPIFSKIVKVPIFILLAILFFKFIVLNPLKNLLSGRFLKSVIGIVVKFFKTMFGHKKSQTVIIDDGSSRLETVIEDPSKPNRILRLFLIIFKKLFLFGIFLFFVIKFVTIVLKPFSILTILGNILRLIVVTFIKIIFPIALKFVKFPTSGLGIFFVFKKLLLLGFLPFIIKFVAKIIKIFFGWSQRPGGDCFEASRVPTAIRVIQRLFAVFFCALAKFGYVAGNCLEASGPL